MKLLRVFPRRTNLTPDDAEAFVGEPPLWLPPDNEVSEIHVSVAFTWDLPLGRYLQHAWQSRFPAADVQIGGPALDDTGSEFEPGRYLKAGAVITSRGCVNRCSYCKVPQREGRLRTLTIRDGWLVQDNNLLACPPRHIAAVFEMLRRQPNRPAFKGGIEAARVTEAIARELLSLRPTSICLAYDLPSDREDVDRALAIFREVSGWKPGTLRRIVTVYLLSGAAGDTVQCMYDRVNWCSQRGGRAWPQYFQDDVPRRVPPEWRDAIGKVCTWGKG